MTVQVLLTVGLQSITNIHQQALYKYCRSDGGDDESKVSEFSMRPCPQFFSISSESEITRNPLMRLRTLQYSSS